VDPATLGPADHDVLAGALEDGVAVALGVVPSADPAGPTSDAALTGAVTRWLDMVGLEPNDSLVVTPACGLAGATPAWARRALESARVAARDLAG
jgi:hypothetical protein